MTTKLLTRWIPLPHLPVGFVSIVFPEMVPTIYRDESSTCPSPRNWPGSENPHIFLSIHLFIYLCIYPYMALNQRQSSSRNDSVREPRRRCPMIEIVTSRPAGWDPIKWWPTRGGRWASCEIVLEPHFLIISPFHQLSLGRPASLSICQHTHSIQHTTDEIERIISINILGKFHIGINEWWGRRS